MPKSGLFSLFPLAALGLSLSAQAGATTVEVGVSAPANYSATIFSSGNSTSGPGAWTFAGGAMTLNASIAGTCLDPFATANYYACATGGSVITANFSEGIVGFDLFWGSPDVYNTITFYTGLNGTGTAEAFEAGTPPLVEPPGGQSGQQAVLFIADPGVVWQSVIFTSAFNSFEFGTVETLAPSPEPSTIALLCCALLGIGAIRLRKLA